MVQMLFSQRGQSTSLCPCFKDWMPRRMKRSWRCEWDEEEEAEMRGKKNWKVGGGGLLLTCVAWKNRDMDRNSSFITY